MTWQGAYSEPRLHTSIMPPIGALPPKRTQQAAPVRKQQPQAETAQPQKQSLLATVLAILEGQQQLSVPIEVRVIFSFPVYLPFFSMLALLGIAWLVATRMPQYLWPTDPLRAAIAGACCGCLFRFIVSSSSKRLAWLSSPKMSRVVFPVLLPTAFVGGMPFLVSFAAASCAVITPKPKESQKLK